MNNCFDEGTIQAFLDGELTGGAREAVARHVAVCDACARLLDEAERDSALAFAALEVEFNALVPTERIRTSLYERIAEIEKPRQSFWRRLAGVFAPSGDFGFGSPVIASFAGLILICGLLAIIFTNRQANDEIAAASPASSADSVRQALPESSASEELQKGAADAPNNKAVVREIPADKSPSSAEPARVERIKFTPARQSRPNAKRDAARRDDSIIAKEPYLLGEETYIKTIATLTEQVEARKEEILNPSARVAFESDLAVVNDAINKMKKEVRRNPGNEAARHVLRNSYQTKIDLLNSVADKTELMASLD